MILRESENWEEIKCVIKTLSKRSLAFWTGSLEKTFWIEEFQKTKIQQYCETSMNEECLLPRSFYASNHTFVIFTTYVSKYQRQFIVPNLKAVD